MAIYNYVTYFKGKDPLWINLGSYEKSYPCKQKLVNLNEEKCTFVKCTKLCKIRNLWNLCG